MRFLDINNRSDCIFQFFIGGRQIGKTYSGLRGANERSRNTGNRYLYMRLTESELEEAADPRGELNPYRSLNRDLNSDIAFERVTKKTYGVFEYDGEGDDRVIVRELAIAKSLSSFSNLRGVDLSDVSEIIFDEFIPSEKLRKTPEIKKAGYLFANAYETVNSNRELKGVPPVRVRFLANAFSLDSNILMYFNLIKPIQNMLRKGVKRFTDKERSIYIELCEAPEVALAKRETALYKALRGNDFEKFAIDNTFRDESLFYVLYDVDLTQFKPLIQYENICIYIKKDGSSYYCKEAREKAPYVFSAADRARFISLFFTSYRIAIYDKLVAFDSVNTKLLIEAALDRAGLA